MSSGLKRTAAPPVPGEKGGGGETVPPKKGALSGQGRSSNGSAPAPLTYSGGEVADDVSTNEMASEHVTLEVVLTSGASSSVTVDFNTPMRDLLIHLAATFRVAPTAHVLQLLDQESGKVLDFKPSQTIGALGATTVYMVPKNKKAEWGKAMKASSKASGAFEITNRFTINLPGGQKAVMRISPQLTLEQVFSRVCQDKSLDSRRYTLQHPDNPLAPLDLKATIAENRLTEINIIHAVASSSAGQQASKSMPDLHHGSAASLPSAASKDPASWYMPGAGETKKKRGFLSFLTKKDKKFKPHDTRYTMAANSPASQPPPPAPGPSAAATLPRKSSTPPVQRRAPDVSTTTPRPKTLYVIDDVSRGADVSGAGKVSNAPAPSKGPAPGKKRHAPPPPPQKKKAAEAGMAAPSSSKTPPVPKTSVDSRNAPLSVSAEASASRKSSSSAAAAAEAQASVTVKPSPADAPPGLSRFHSRNSSDSSGYHELTLSGAESPEASRVPTTLKTSIDTTSIESADHPNGDSGIQDLSPPGGVETSSVAGHHSDRAGLHPGRDVAVKQQGQISSAGKPDKKPKPPPSTKKKKAPPPPPKAAKAAPPVQDKSSGVASSQPAPPDPTPPPTSVAATRVSETASPQHSHQEQVAVSAVVHTHHEKTSSAGGDHDGDESDSDSGEPFNLNDILDAVNFEDEPVRTDTTTSTTTEAPEEDESGRMAMIETASVLSENVEDIKSRPCEFIPPPPPEEPPPEDYLPPADYPPPEEYSSSAGAGTVYQDKGTVVGEDNASLAPASLKSSPESMYHRRSESRASLASLGSIDTVEGLSLAFAQTIAMGEEALESERWQEEQGYSNEMARFVAQMSRLTTDRPPDGGDLSSNNTSVSLPDTESVSDTGSVVYHARGDSKDSQSSLGSVERSADSSVRGKHGEAGVASTFAVMEEIDAPLETVPPPLEFQGDEEEEEEEEEVTVVTEQYISPMGTNFQASARMPEDEEQDSRRNTQGSYSGVFRAEPVSILPPHQTFMEQREEEKPAAKEEFVLTLEDLSDVSLVPRRPKIPVPPKPILKPALMEPDPQLEPETEPVAAGRRTEPLAFAQESSGNASSFGYRSGRPDRMSTDRRLSRETDNPPKPGMSGDKPVSTLFLPTMRYSHSVEPLSFSDDEQSSVNSIGDHVHRSSAKAVAGDDVSDASSDRSGGLDSRRVSASSNASHTLPSPADVDPDLTREDVQQQFSTLQDQFVLWQQQLQQNQALLASHSSGSADTNDDTLKTLQAQMQMQQQMMMQLQMSMEALSGQPPQQQQQHQQHSTDIPAAPVDIPTPALPAEESPSQSSMSPPSYPPPPPPISESPELPPSPPPPPPPPPAPVQAPTPAPKVIKAETKPKTSRASRFEPKLDPREELMIAIRSFGGHEKLKPVPAEATK